MARLTSRLARAMPLRKLLGAAMIGLALLGGAPRMAAADTSSTAIHATDITATDITGREIVLPAPARRIVLGEGRHLTVLGLIQPDPVSLVVGWRLDKPLEPATLAAYRAKFPAIDAIAPVGAGNRSLSVESIIALEPDLVLLSLMDAEDPKMQPALEQLASAGIPVAFVDFFSHPLENAMPSLRLLGKLTGAEDRAEAFAQFYEGHLETIRSRLAAANPPKPRVFLHVHAVAEGCCATVGTGVFQDFIAAAGGYNIGKDTVPGALGNVSLEHVIAADPDFYLATGGEHLAARGGLVLGPGIPDATAEETFAKLIAAPGFSSLRAVETGQAAGFWHLFNDSPVHIALIEYMAKAFHPDLFADLDPAATLNEIQTRFAPVSVPGSWWVTAAEADAAP
jgi:iron complex transport system substrate-binding protein